MSEAKLTPWFGMDRLPHRIGVYQVLIGPAFGCFHYSFFDGHYFCGTAGNPWKAKEFGPAFGHTGQSISGWRGLAEKPA